MVSTIDVDFCGNLMARVGEQLLDASRRGEDASRRGEYTPDWQGMLQRFMETNAMAEDQIKSALLQKYPDIAWSTGEFDREKLRGSEFAGDYWMCDPIDGAINFLQGLPFWSTSLCLIHNGQPQVSLVYDAYQKDLFSANAGGGAFLNGEQIHVSQRQAIKEAILATSQPSNVWEDAEDTLRTTRAISQILPKAFALRTLGSVSLQLAYVARGRFDGFWEFGTDIHDWLAGSLLVREASGTVTDIQSDGFTWGAQGIIAANPLLHQELKNEVVQTSK